MDQPAEGGFSKTGELLSLVDDESFIRLAAHHVGAEAHAGSPFVFAELSENGERFKCALPPIRIDPTEQYPELAAARK